ncbi:unnamed protein product [Clonostachys rosea]|uniref:EF-hand domain-containing protein n=1 Tax=Bionectria ochroleuca TaxID=29856 RepID=A0ABY6V066_BIOOC|nr:unnamed protein product [Clonostachys rosea]
MPPSLKRNSGFIQLQGSGTNKMSEEGIQLTTVKSNVSTGARKPTMGNASTSGSDNLEKEKSGLHFISRGRRKTGSEKLGRRGTGDSDDEPARLNFMGRIYTKLFSFSIVSRYLVYIVPVAIILAVPIIVLAALGKKETNRLPESDDPTLEGPPLFRLFLWIEITWCTVWLAKLVAYCLPQTVMTFVGVVSAGTRKYAAVLTSLQLPLSLFFWALAVWLTNINLFKQWNDLGWVKVLNRIFGSLFVSSAVFLGEKAIVQLIAVSYHQRSFANRIKESKREVHLLGMLYDASKALFPMYSPEFVEEDYVINDTIEAKLGGARHARGKSGVVNPTKLIGEVGRFGDKVTSAFGNIASEITGKKVFNPNSTHSIVLEALEKLKSSEALARRIWMSFVVEGKDALYFEDVAEVLGPQYKAEAEEAFNALDGDGNGDISLQEMIRKVVDIGKERIAIAEGMKDIGQALSAFDRVLLFVVLLIVIFIFLSFFQSSAVTTIASAGTTLLSLSFIFAVTCQEFLGSCIFLFVKHPYDVGDRVYISDVQLIVERISLLYTVFTRTSTGQITQVPNIQLNNLWVDNITRSKAMSESIAIDVSFDTTFEEIELLRQEMEAFVQAPENSRDFQPNFNIGIGGVNDLDKLTLKFSILHKSNWNNEMVRATRRSKFICALATALKKIPIYGPAGGADALGGPSNPTYSVAVSDDFATKARDESAKKKEEARFVPLDKKEEEAIENISARPPVVEMAGTGTNWDNHTLHPDGDNGRSMSLDIPRNDLVKRSSTGGGRRKAGDTLPAHSASLRGAVPPVSPTRSNRDIFDEEAQMGLYPTTSFQSTHGASLSATQTQPSIYPSQSQQSQQQRYPPGYQGPPPPAGQR